MAVRAEQVVVVALEQVAAADVDRRGLAAEPGPALVHVDRMTGLRQAQTRDEAGDAGPEDSDSHDVGSSTLMRSPTTYSGRCLTSS